MVHTSVDEYISTFPKDTQEILNKIRRLVKEQAPESTESISYQMPAFKINGKYLVYFAAWENHIALYPATSSMEASKEMDQYIAGKGTFQLPLEKALPFDLIRKIVRQRKKDVLAK